MRDGFNTMESSTGSSIAGFYSNFIPQWPPTMYVETTKDSIRIITDITPDIK